MGGDTHHVLKSRGVGDTIAIGRLLGGALNPGDVVGLTGELGSGKTVLAKGIAAGLGFGETDLVTSPTYKVLNQYNGRVIINHFDAYRLDGADDFAVAGGDDLVGGAFISVVEWAERVAAALPPRTIRIFIRVLSEYERELEFVLPESRKALAAVMAGASVRSSRGSEE